MLRVPLLSAVLRVRAVVTSTKEGERNASLTKFKLLISLFSQLCIHYDTLSRDCFCSSCVEQMDAVLDEIRAQACWSLWRRSVLPYVHETRAHSEQNEEANHLVLANRD